MLQSTYSISQAQAQLPRLAKSQRLIAVTRKGKLVAYLVPAKTMTALLETQEILADREAMKAIRDFETGKTKRWRRIDEIPD
jgi:PHD/YefM family antitoxin component YafN of YafNO toxin-antitoxin module